MKFTLIAIGEMLLLFAAALVGFVMHPFNVEKVLHTENGVVRAMVYDWIIAAAIAWFVLLVIEFGIRRNRDAWLRPTLCFVAVVTLGLISHLGLKSTEVSLYRF
ncbi:hypothetical protein FTW19_01625 [Terriglobus albidus]|uniref:Uncharacterized protein n=1 Tax=Terriglobus albidus TaxID=1592106 RepID=A0A5B9E6U6_9BACT|nr:hypothetical protein [Terriglobus albidus]QEE26815.1 hypothetical protein FTW19_01625 [Terriglobus albidus]